METDKKRDWILLAIAVLAVAGMAVGMFVTTRVTNTKREAQAAVAASLLNAGFEDGFRSVNGVGELGVGESWYPWWKEGPEHRPEYKEETTGVGSGRVYAGDSAQKQFTTFSQQDGGVRQSVKIEAGQWYEFTAWVYVWSSSQSDPNTSIGGKCSAMVGINP